MSTPPEHPNQSEEELRVVVDAQIVLTMFLARRDRPGLASTKRELLGLLTEPKFRWLWTPDIINDYERSADAIESDNRIMRRAEFDRVGFQLFLAALQLLRRRRFSSAENQRESAGCSQFVFVFTSAIQWANRRRFYDLTNLFPETC